MKKSHKKIYEQNIEDFGLLDPQQILALTLYGEARGESREGKIGVGTVILERVQHRNWDGKTIHEVCLWPYQFSCFNLNDPNRIKMLELVENKTDKHYLDCLEIATGLINGDISPDKEISMADCCQYLTTKAKQTSTWWTKMKFVKKIGNHEFYTDLK